MAYTICKYTPDCRQEWDRFVETSKNATFLHLRGYMDYHADRFDDNSLIARDPRGRIIALLPANRRGSVVVSHQGLTYGGWLTAYKHLDAASMLEIHQLASALLKEDGATDLIYKPVPYIYTTVPAQEDLYMLFRCGAIRIASLISSAIDLRTDAGPDADRRRKSRQALSYGIEVRESDDYTSYWQILSDVLASRHNARPVHTLAEITLLRDRFPSNIRLFAAFSADGEMIAGTVLYITRGVVHTQYLAASEEGRRTNALTLVLSTLIDRFRREGYRWLDFGTSCEDGGNYLNEGLIRQKESLGGRAVVYDTYSLPL